MELKKAKLMKVDQITDLKKLVSIEDTKKYNYEIKELFKNNTRLVYE